MEHATNSLQLAMACDLVKIGFENLALGPTASHNAFEWIVEPVGKIEQMPGLVEHIRLIDIGLQVHRLRHVQPLDVREIVGHPEGAIQMRNRVEPRVTKEIQIPEVLVCVYDLHSRLIGRKL